MGFNQRVDCFSKIFQCCNFEICARENLIAAHVNDLALFVHHFVVLQHVLSNFTVALFNCCLCALDGLRNHLCFDCFIVWKCAPHDPTECTCCKEAHEFVIKAEIKTTCAGIALTSRATTQLVVNTAAVMAFSSENIQATDRTNFAALFCTLCFLQWQQFVVTSLSCSTSSLEFFGHFSNRCWQCEIVNQQVWADTF